MPYSAPLGKVSDEFRAGWNAGYQRALKDVLEKHPKLRGKL